MAKRFFCDSPIDGATATLGDEETRHLVQAMRRKSGDQVVLFDGLGGEYLATITKVDRRSVELTIDERVETDRELNIDLTLAVALPKGDRQTWMVQKLVELGVTRLIPLVTEYGVAQPTGKALDRLQRHIIEASKQCGRNKLMQLLSPRPLTDITSMIDPHCRRLVAHVHVHSNSLPPPEGNVCFAIGPEGGFTEGEVELLVDEGWNTIQLGPRLLRIETAAVSVAAWWSFSCGLITLR